MLIAKQWDWVYYYIIQGLPLKEIVEMKGVFVEAVKGCGEGSKAEVARVGCQAASESPKVRIYRT
ncbi:MULTISPECIES: hypothetical protein [unclassified Oceanobacillus]|uniref:hypothetical protein n=1 Tax=unclassified Oceanobacillus TaxID=2630292 RepID=UPI00300E48A4